jgi:hypothetical protein
MADYKKLAEKYREKIEKKLGTEVEAAESYSVSYRQFKKEQTKGAHTFFEKACIFSERILKVTPSPKDLEKVKPYLKLAHLEITPESVYSLAYLSTLVSVVFFGILGLVTFNLFMLIIGLAASLVLLVAVPEIPKSIFNTWRSRASDQLVLAVLYMVIYMEHTSNLERAVEFVAKHMPPPISLDFMKILWNVETKKYASVKESLDAYTETWVEKGRSFVQSIQLVESALLEPSAEEKQSTLEKAVQVILDGTQDRMINYAHSLQSPIQTLHMLGIVLPVMGMVMLPMVGAFLGESVSPGMLFALYNVILPILVYVIGKQILTTRPAGTSSEDVYLFSKKIKEKKRVKIGKTTLPLTPRMAAIAVFFLVGLPALLYLPRGFFLTGQALTDFTYGNTTLYISIDLIAAIGLAFATYYRFTVAPLIKSKRAVEATENEFTTAAFQLGNRLQEHVPAELVFSKVAETMKKSEIANFFRIIDYNVRQLGVSIKDAIYNEKYGAIKFYPSALIKNTMFILTEGIKKGPEIAGRSMITISKYLGTVHRVEQRLKDLLADTTSSMAMQVKMFIPLISGIVVGLAALTTVIMLNLATRLGTFEATEGVPLGAGLLDVFQSQAMIPPYIFQIIIGLYVIQLTLLLSFLLTGVIHGHDRIEEQYLMAQNLFIATLLYAVITLVTTLLFGSLAGPLTGIEYG